MESVPSLSPLDHSDHFVASFIFQFTIIADDTRDDHSLYYEALDEDLLRQMSVMYPCNGSGPSSGEIESI